MHNAGTYAVGEGGISWLENCTICLQYPYCEERRGGGRIYICVRSAYDGFLAKAHKQTNNGYVMANGVFIHIYMEEIIDSLNTGWNA